MEITLGQQYNVGEKPAFINNVVHHDTYMVVVIYYYIGYKYKATPWYLNGFLNGNNLGSTV